MTRFGLILTLFLTLSSWASAQFPEDHPAPDESFFQFFARITHGGQFPGIRLQAPEKFQQSFLKSFLRGTWVGQVDLARNQIQNTGGDLWNGFYRSQKVADWIFPKPEWVESFAHLYDSATMSSAACQAPPTCRPWMQIQSSDFSTWTTAEREAFTLTYVTQTPLFSGRRVIDFLADRYDSQASLALSHFYFQLLSSADFEKAVRRLGWAGPIYFRGIAAPDPENPQMRVILMNDELMRKMTPFEAPVLQALEYVCILTHEISHVFQDLDARGMGLDLEIRSAEGALLIEGGAEFQAEAALRAAGQTWTDVPQTLSLAAAEAGQEVVYRPGNEQTGNLFPYTVGLPFAAALESEFQNSSSLRLQIYKTILDQQSLGQMLVNLENSSAIH